MYWYFLLEYSEEKRNPDLHANTAISYIYTSGYFLYRTNRPINTCSINSLDNLCQHVHVTILLSHQSRRTNSKRIVIFYWYRTRWRYCPQILWRWKNIWFMTHFSEFIFQANIIKTTMRMICHRACMILCMSMTCIF